MNNILTEFQKSGLKFDRICTDIFSLPYKLAEIEIQPNELATNSTLNLKLEKLYYNTLYLYGLCNIANFVLPKEVSGWIGALNTSDKIEFYTSTYAGASSFAVNLDYANVTDSYIARVFKSETKTNYIIANATYLTLFSLDNQLQQVTFTKKQSLIDPLSGSLFFQNIAGIEVDGGKNLYVLDKTLCNLYQYDLEAIYTDDYVFSQRLFLKDAIGGLGGRYDTLKFNSPNNIVFTGTEIIVEDTGNKAFKVYDKDLNFLNLTVAITLFDSLSAGFNNLIYDAQNSMLVGCTNNSLYFLKYDKKFAITFSTSYLFDRILEPGEFIKDVRFATYEPSILYVLTNKRIFKKWITKINNNIGIITNDIVGGSGFQWIANAPLTNSQDQLSVLCLSGSKTFISVMTDELDLISLFKNIEFNIYNLNDIKINADEYVQSWVFNKSFKKLTYDLFLLTSYVGYRFFQGLDSNNTPIFVRRGYNQFLLNNTVEDLNTFAVVCVNENFQSSVINRCLAKLYGYQLKLLNSIINNETVYEVLVETPGPVVAAPGTPSQDFITYIAGTGVFLNPSPAAGLFYGSDTLVSIVTDVLVAGNVPYVAGAGINIIITG